MTTAEWLDRLSSWAPVWGGGMTVGFGVSFLIHLIGDQLRIVTAYFRSF